MKKFFTSLMFLLTLLIFVGCERERPIVDFGGGGTDNTQYPIASFDYYFYDNFEIDFYNESTDATSYSWSFGDGQSSTEEEPSH